MKTTWTSKQVQDLAPDAASAKAGQSLARPAKWQELGQRDQMIWGAVQGSGKDPYRVRIDLSEPAYKCSCPSRKFPCKHALGLMFILADHPGAVSESDPPDWVSEWAEQRSARQQAKVARASDKKEVDSEAQTRRAAKRDSRVKDGIDDLTVWLHDLVRQGFGRAQSQPASYWNTIAARLVDAQAPGLARRVGQLSELVSSGEGWQSRLLGGVARIHLICEAFRRLDSLPEEVQADVRTAVGWNVSTEELQQLSTIADTWCVVAQRIEREDQLRVLRTWLLGLKTQRFALILQFAAGTQAFGQNFMLGAQFETAVTYYPGAAPLRAAILGERGEPKEKPHALPQAPSWLQAQGEFAQVLSRQPWAESWPIRVGGLVPRRAQGVNGVVFCDAEGRCIPLLPRFDGAWHLAAISGGQPMELFGEWDGISFRPLSASIEDRLYTFGTVAAGTTLERVA